MKVRSDYYEVVLSLKTKNPFLAKRVFIIIEKINYASTSNGSIET
jgi:hypothetical protein